MADSLDSHAPWLNALQSTQFNTGIENIDA